MSNHRALNDGELDWYGLFQALIQRPLQISLVATGGGTGAVTQCFRRPGASLLFVEAVIPYSRTALAGYLTAAPRGSSASPERAHQMASTAMARADALADKEPPYEAVGIALTAALPTTIERRGDDRIHVALHSQSRRVLWSLDLTNENLDRETAESIADEMFFVALAELQSDSSQPANGTSGCRLLRSLPLIRKAD